MGKDRWYEKISMQYTGKMTNSVTTTESEVFSKKTLDNMKNGIEHSIPISASFNLFNYINVAVGQLHREVVFQEGRVRVEPLSPTRPTRCRRTTVSTASTTTTSAFRPRRPSTDVRLHEEELRPQDPGHPPHADPLDRLLLRPRTSATPKYGYTRPARPTPRDVSDLFALCRERLRRPVVGTFDVDELLAVAEPRNEGASRSATPRA